ncbi:polyprenol reductase-like isoform X1 [Mya arenaria]|uniref:polyprenol reductase-like isoform X1 n=1 Tax=Mya arenaria TaxID=6604 RepID=UPI0022E63367|nr:polyprenol reductase-like isoform X1 [Mya arenaria]
MISLCSLIWGVCSVWVLLGALFVAFPQYSPAVILDLYVYGKIRKTDGKSKQSDFLLFPKSFFSHFYLGGIIWISTLLVLSLSVACQGGEFPDIVNFLIDLMRYPNVKVHGDVFPTLLVLVCSDIQVVRRFLECKLVSVYSPGGKMSIIIYLVGVCFYAALPLTTVSGTDFAQKICCASFLDDVKFYHAVGVSVFLWASWHQNRAVNQFAKLRQNKSGSVENTRHHIPHGGLFQFVSCPHYTMEIIIYLSLCIITAFQNNMLVALFVFVLINQVVTGYFTHAWYKETFKNYPKDRKAVLPFLL